MFDDFDAAIHTIISIRESDDHWPSCVAKRLVLRHVAEMESFYTTAFHYPLRDECEFEDLILQLEKAREKQQKEQKDAVNALVELVYKMWSAKRGTAPLEGRHEFERDLEAMWNEYRLLHGEDAEIRLFLAELYDANAYDVWHFEKYLESLGDTVRLRYKKEHGELIFEEDSDWNVLKGAKDYLSDNWCPVRMPWLTDFYLVLLFDNLRASCKKALTGPEDSARFVRTDVVELWMPNLTLIRNELASRAYDPTETIRRLRQLEEKGGVFVVPSLAYSLLQLQLEGRK